jgi:hypothetical protein
MHFAPVLVDKDKWVLGFDSGIARGGIAIYNVDEDE